MIIEKRRVALKALVGSHNYNLQTAESDKDYKVLVIPTFEELYKGQRFAKQIITETEDYDMHDIRKVSDLFYKANINYLEILASKDLIIPKGYPELEKIYSMRKEIFKMNLPYLFNACNGMHKQKMALLHKGTEGTQHLVDKYGYDTKQAQHAFRCMNFIVRFESTNFEDFEGSLWHEGHYLDFMLDIKGGFYKKQEHFEKFANGYHEKMFMPLKEKYRSQPVNMELKEEVDNLIMQLIKREITE